MTTPNGQTYPFETCQTIEDLKRVMSQMRDDLCAGNVFPAQTGT